MKRISRFANRGTCVALLALSTLAGAGALPFHNSANAAGRVVTKKAAPLFQFSTLPALSLGLYDGHLTFGEVLKHGDFGVGTFDALDGEAIILDGKAWQARADGRVLPVDAKATTPFAAVTRFAPDRTLKIAKPMEYSALQSQLTQMLPTPNVPYAIEIKGTFARIIVRSVPKQARPYRKLADVVKTQSVWEWKNVKGTLVGFRFPAYLAGVNLADYHFHFLSEDKSRGGHLLDCELQNGEVEIEAVRNFQMQLPAGSDFDRANLAGDQSADVKASENGGAH